MGSIPAGNIEIGGNDEKVVTAFLCTKIWKKLIVSEIFKGEDTPYYYSSDGVLFR